MGKLKRPTAVGNVPDKSQQVQEIIACGKSASHFISTYVRISHPIKGPIPFKTYPFQNRCLDAFQKNRFVITNKSRQLGLSTLSAAYSLHMALFQREKNILVIATKLETAKNFIRKVSGMYDQLPRWLVMPQIKARSTKNLEFSNGSKIQAIPTGQDAGRSEALSLLILDEAAHIENIEDLWLGLRPCLSTGGNCIMISTPSGVGSLFHKIWIGASRGEDGEGNAAAGNGTNEFYRIELPWTVHPDRTQEWYDNEAAEIRPAHGEPGVLQELMCVFGATGDAFLPLDVMEKLEHCITTPIAYYGPRNDVWIWKMPVDAHRYVIGGDVARGDADDFSAFHVVDITTDEIVCDYQGKINPEDFGNLMVDLGHKYNKALLCPELNSFGMLTAMTLKKSGYPNLYYEKISRNMYVSYTDADVKDELPGITTGTKNREEFMAKLENYIKGGRIRLYSSRFIDELKTLVWKTNTRAQAMKGYNDDLCVLGDTLIQTNCGVKKITEIEIGDLVLTHKGRYKPVVKKFVNYKTSYSLLKSRGNMGIGITPNHPLFVAERNKSSWKSWSKIGSCVNLAEPEFLAINGFKKDTKYYVSSITSKEVKNVEKIDLLSYTERKGFYVENGLIRQNFLRNTAYNKKSREYKVNNPKFNSVPYQIPVDDDFCFILGYYLAEGSCYKNGVSFAYNFIHEKELSNSVRKYFAKYGFSTSVSQSKTSNGSTLLIHSVLLKDFFSRFGKSDDKHLSAEFLSLPKEKLFQIMSGYFAGDGHVTEDGSIISLSISPNIVFLMRNICLSNDICSNVKVKKNWNKIVKFGNRNHLTKKPYTFSVNSYDAQNIIKTMMAHGKDVSYIVYEKFRAQKKNQAMSKIRQNYQHNQIISIENIETKIATPVYNLEVAEDNSYIANGIAVHNCIAAALGVSLYEAAGANVWDNVEMTTSLLSGLSVGVKRMNGIGGNFGNENKQMPPILTNRTLGQYTAIADGKAKQEAQRQGPQNFSNGWWSLFRWVVDD